MQGLEIVKGSILSHPKSPPFVVTFINVDNKPPSHPPPLSSPLKPRKQGIFSGAIEKKCKFIQFVAIFWFLKLGQPFGESVKQLFDILKVKNHFSQTLV
jgi:hypothetical protein